jgi:hypothetical protein
MRNKLRYILDELLAFLSAVNLPALKPATISFRREENSVSGN